MLNILITNKTIQYQTILSESSNSIVHKIVTHCPTINNTKQNTTVLNNTDKQNLIQILHDIMSNFVCVIVRYCLQYQTIFEYNIVLNFQQRQNQTIYNNIIQYIKTAASSCLFYTENFVRVKE